MRTSRVAEKGVREHQEDRCFVFQGSHHVVMAVFDGHTDERVADMALAAMDTLVSKSLAGNPMQMVKRIFNNIITAASDFSSGSTMSLAWIEDGHAVIGFLGDSPILVVDAMKQVHTFAPHNVGNPEERAAVIARGGNIIHKSYVENPKKYGSGIQLTRVLGDRDYDSVVSREPSIHVIDDPILVMVGSDGFACTSEDFPEIAELASGTASANDFLVIAERNAVRDALYRGVLIPADVMRWGHTPILTDNTTIAVWQK